MSSRLLQKHGNTKPAAGTMVPFFSDAPLKQKRWWDGNFKEKGSCYIRSADKDKEKLFDLKVFGPNLKKDSPKVYLEMVIKSIEIMLVWEVCWTY